MFTGIVQGVRSIISTVSTGGVQRLRLDLSDLNANLVNGASVAVNGTCLTVAAHEDNWAEFDVIPETLRTTNLANIRTGDRVNVERSARMIDEVGGHRVSGHISGLGTVIRIALVDGDYQVWIKVPDALMSYLLRKGFVSVNGASLTISDVAREECAFAVSLIPETLTRTTFGVTHAGAKLNIEVDATTQAIVDTVRSVLTDPSLRSALLAGVNR